MAGLNVDEICNILERIELESTTWYIAYDFEEENSDDTITHYYYVTSDDCSETLDVIVSGDIIKIYRHESDTPEVTWQYPTLENMEDIDDWLEAYFAVCAFNKNKDKETIDYDKLLQKLGISEDDIYD